MFFRFQLLDGFFKGFECHNLSIEQAGKGNKWPLKVLLTTAAEAVDLGLFPAVAKACDNCDYRTLCGPGAEKRGERKRDDMRVGDYFKLEELK